MKVATWYNRSVLLLLILAITSYATAAGAPEFAALAAPTVVALWRLSCRKVGRFLLPRFVVNILLFAVVAYALLRSQMSLTVETIAQVVILIQVIKIGDRRTPRDDGQILCLSVFLAIAAMLDSNGVWTGIQIAVFFPILVTTVMLFQLHRGEVLAGAASYAEPPGESRRFRKQLRATSALATTGTLGLALVVFILLPRGVGADVFGRWGSGTARRETGFSSSVTLGTKGIISTSPTVVLDLVVKDENGANLGAADVMQYLRGAVLTEYAGGGKWSPRSPDRRFEMQLGPGLQPYRRGMQTAPVVEQSISLRSSPGNEKWTHLFAMWRPVQVQFGRPGDLRTDSTVQVLQRRADSGPFDYTVISSLTDPRKSEDPWVDPPAVDSPRIHALAESIVRATGLDPDPKVRGHDEDVKIARAIQDYLRSSFSYTLEQESPPAGTDPIDFFLFDRKQGHCEYFASAMTLMCWSVGINARMVTGYVATEFSPTTGAYVVRESNAHAWVEAETDEHRWRRFDPTPPDDLVRIHRPTIGVFGRLRHLFDAVEYAWNSSVVAFDEKARQQLLGPSQGEQTGWLGAIERASQRVRFGGPRLVMRALLTGVVVFVAVAALGFILTGLLALIRRKLGTQHPGTSAGGHRSSITPRFYRNLIRWLAQRGLAKPAWRPPLDHATAIALVDPALGESVRDVVEQFYRTRFGGHVVSPRERAKLERAVKSLRKSADHPQSS